MFHFIIFMITCVIGLADYYLPLPVRLAFIIIGILALIIGTKKQYEKEKIEWFIPETAIKNIKKEELEYFEGKLIQVIDDFHPYSKEYQLLCFRNNEKEIRKYTNNNNIIEKAKSREYTKIYYIEDYILFTE